MNRQESHWARFLSGLFASLLFLLPPPFRRRFGPDVRSTLDEALREAEGISARASAFGRAAADLMGNLVPEWLDWMRGEQVPARGSAPSLRPGGQGGGFGFGSVMQDTRFALRVLRRRLLFSALTVATLGLSIGAATAMFSVVDGVLLRPLPYPEADRVLAVWETPDPVSRWYQPFTGPDYFDVREESRTLEELGVISLGSLNLAGEGEPVRLQSGAVTASLFNLLGIQPAQGRYFT